MTKSKNTMAQFHPKLVAEMRNLMASHETSLKEIAKLLKARWRENSPKAETADETMYNLGRQDGKCEGPDAFLQEIEVIASQPND